MTKNPEKPQKTAKKCGFCGLENRNIFFLKIGLRHFSPLTLEQLHAKNLRNPMMGSMRTFVTDGRTDRQTDGPGYIGPAPISGAGPTSSPHYTAPLVRVNLGCCSVLRNVNQAGLKYLLIRPDLHMMTSYDDLIMMMS